MQKLFRAGLAALFALCACAAHAAIVPVAATGQWFTFDVDDLAANSGGVEWIDTGAAFGEALSFSLTVSAPSVLQVVDAGFAGDRFRVFIDGGAGPVAYLTGAAIDSFPDASGDFDLAWDDDRYSRLSVILDPGTYTVSGELFAAAGGGAPLNVTVGALRLQVPEPAGAALVGLGLAALWARRRRAAHAAAFTCAMVAATPAIHAATPPPPFTVKIIAFNDYHGNLQSPGTFGVNTAVPVASRPAVGGAEYLAAHVARLKARNPLNVVVGAGDFIGATPLISSLFHDEPAIETLNRIGLEFNAVGNHEFDRGAAELLRLQNGGCKLLPGGGIDPNSCKGALVGTPVPFEGAKFRWLAANVVRTATGRTVLPAYGVKTFNGVRVAFIGMTLRATPTIVTPTGVAGLEFRDEADTVNALVPRLRALGIEAIVVLVHEGGFQGASLSDINGCVGDLAGSALAGIVSRLDNAVDLVVSGHTHAAYNCSATTVDATGTPAAPVLTPRPTGLPNASGRRVPVTSASAFGRVLTDIDVTIDPATRDIVAVAPVNRLVDRTDPAVAPNAQVAAIVAGYNNLVSPIANQVIGSITTSLPNTASDKACNMPAGDLIADAQLAATAAPGFGDAVIAFMNRGGVRNPGFNFAQSVGEGDGNVTYGEAFTVQPFGNSLVTMTLTAQDIKNVLEEQFAGCRGQSPTATRIMIPSNGFKYTWDGAAACNARIRSVTLTQSGVTETLVDGAGTVLLPNKPYRVTVNNFMATGGDGYSTFLNGTALLGGAQDIDALTAFMGGFKAPLPPYTPGVNPDDAGAPRIARVGGTSCPGGANTNL